MRRDMKSLIRVLLVLVLAISASGCTGKYEGTIAILNDDMNTAWYVIETGYQPAAERELVRQIETEAHAISPGATVLLPAQSSYIGFALSPEGFGGGQQDSITIIVYNKNARDEYTFQPTKDKFSVYFVWDGSKLAVEEGVRVK
jgi:hypothetical protein